MGYENQEAQEVYEAQGLEGPALDFERIFQASNRAEALALNKEARTLYEDVVGIIDEEKFSAEAGNIEEIEKVIRAIRIAAKVGGWKSYEDANFDSIRAELERSGVPLRERRTKKDLS